MKTLLWKDFRQNARMLLGVGIFILLPYMFVLSLGVASLFYKDLNRTLRPSDWANLFNIASFWSTGLSVVMYAFIAGNAIAGERADRSAEFAAYLPIPPKSAIISKATLAVSVCLFIWFANESVLYLTGSHPLSDSMTAERLRLMADTSVLIFGAAWLCSTILNSPALSAASGIAAVVAVAWGNVIVGNLLEIPVEFFSSGYITTSIGVGITCFIAGIIHYLRRTEP